MSLRKPYDNIRGQGEKITDISNSDVAYISYFTCLATVSSIVQQLYDYILWQDIMIEQFYYGKQHAHDAETQYQRGIMGLKLALSYIRTWVPFSFFLVFKLKVGRTTRVRGAGRTETSQQQQRYCLHLGQLS